MILILIIGITTGYVQSQKKGGGLIHQKKQLKSSFVQPRQRKLANLHNLEDTMFDPTQVPWYVWYGSGFLTALGLLILLPNRISNPITSNDNLGWVLAVGGMLLLIVWFLVPFGPIIWDAVVLVWTRGSVTMIVALIVGVLLAAMGGIILYRRANP